MIRAEARHRENVLVLSRHEFERRKMPIDGCYLLPKCHTRSDGSPAVRM